METATSQRTALAPPLASNKTPSKDNVSPSSDSLAPLNPFNAPRGANESLVEPGLVISPAMKEPLAAGQGIPFDMAGTIVLRTET